MGRVTHRKGKGYPPSPATPDPRPGITPSESSLAGQANPSPQQLGLQDRPPPISPQSGHLMGPAPWPPTDFTPIKGAAFPRAWGPALQPLLLAPQLARHLPAAPPSQFIIIIKHFEHAERSGPGLPAHGSRRGLHSLCGAAERKGRRGRASCPGSPAPSGFTAPQTASLHPPCQLC